MAGNRYMSIELARPGAAEGARAEVAKSILKTMGGVNWQSPPEPDKPRRSRKSKNIQRLFVTGSVGARIIGDAIEMGPA
jgi:hypothetical protein